MLGVSGIERGGKGPCPVENGAMLTPEPDCSVADVDAAFGHQILDPAQRQRVPHVHHHRDADDLGGAVKAPKGSFICRGYGLPFPASSRFSLTMPPEEISRTLPRRPETGVLIRGLPAQRAAANSKSNQTNEHW